MHDPSTTIFFFPIDTNTITRAHPFKKPKFNSQKLFLSKESRI